MNTLHFQHWLQLQESDSPDNLSAKLNQIILVASKVEEYTLGLRKLTRNAISVPQTIIDLATAAKKHLEIAGRPLASLEEKERSRQELQRQMQNAAKLVPGSVLTGIPAFLLKGLALATASPLVVTAAAVSLCIYTLAYYAMTLANDLTASGEMPQWRRMLVSIGNMLKPLLPDRMSQVMFKDKTEEVRHDLNVLMEVSLQQLRNL